MRMATLLAMLAVASPMPGEPLRVAAQASSFFRQEGDSLVGLEHDLLAYHSKVAKRPLEVTFLPFDQLLPQLESGRADVAVGLMTITDERLQRVDFSEPYFPTRIFLIEPQGRTTTRLDDLVGSKVGIVRGSTYQEVLGRLEGTELRYFGSITEMVGRIADGTVDAGGIDSAVGFAVMRRNPQLHMTLPLSEEQGFGFAVKKGSPLAAELSRTLQDLKRSQIYFRLLEEHLGEQAVQWVTTGRMRAGE